MRAPRARVPLRISSAIWVAICRYSGGVASAVIPHSVVPAPGRIGTDGRQFGQYRPSKAGICMGSGGACLPLLRCSSRPHSGAMTYPALPPFATVLQITLQPQDPVLPLQCAQGQRAQLEVLSGRLWLTQHGRSDDWFLE
ncbi:MAG: DUF2917 domain-containing protein, partial [Giesbergeria sp.]